jgi:RNA polymerase sigma-70 factor (ECF subfamily)
MPSSIQTPEYLLERARLGDTDAFGTLLTQYQNYIRLMARALAGTALRKRLDSSDLVQEVFLEAHRDFGNWRARARPSF